jgi:hypothetical protein
MKKIKYLVASFLILTAVANANPVLQEKAATVAGNFYGQTYHKAAGTLTLAYTERSSDGQAVYYVYNVGSSEGFVIVSAEDAGYPIIGSSDVGQYVVPPANNNLGYWMGLRKKEIIGMRTQNIKENTDVAETWKAYINNTPRNTHQAMSAVLPLLGSITWDQSPYYNAMCPGGSVTGCVATAMAQIMKYWSYPSVGLSQTCYYDETAYGFSENYGQLCATFDTSNYNWAAMPNRVTSANAQVAKLMYDCGVSVNMDYSPTGSGAFVTGRAPSAQNSYVQYFNYYKWSINGLTQSRDANFVTAIKNELNHNRPVQYQGTDSVYGGHSWVCDGYNSSGDLHMNWGWSGASDGYYSPTDLAPASSPYNFSDQGVGVIIGIEPPSAALGVAPTVNATTFRVYPNPSNGIFNVQLESATGTSQITVYNVLGQQVYFSKLTTVQTSINLSSQPKGVYIYKVLNENGESISTGRLVIE